MSKFWCKIAIVAVQAKSRYAKMVLFGLKSHFKKTDEEAEIIEGWKIDSWKIDINVNLKLRCFYIY